MANLFEATINGTAFSSLSDKLVLTDIIESQAEMDTQDAQLGSGDGMYRLLSRRKSLSVELKFAIRTQNVAERARIMDKVVAWAYKGGVLKTNTRPDKSLSVILDTPPHLGSSAKWTEEVSIKLTALNPPYWASATKPAVSVETVELENGAYWCADVLDLTGKGQLPTERVTFLLINVGELPLTHLKITCEGTVMEFAGLEVPPGSFIMSSYVDGILTVPNGDSQDPGASYLPCRTPESDDDLLATGDMQNQIFIEADAPLRGNMNAQGLWL